jgi:hypothetical protein
MNENMGRIDADTRTLDTLRYYGAVGEPGLTARIQALESEWDGETFTATALSAAGVAGLVMALFGSRMWRLLAWVALPALLVLTRKDWRSPPALQAFLGLRSRREIQEEKYALKAMRGDFRRVDIPLDAVGEALARSSASAMDAVKA